MGDTHLEGIERDFEEEMSVAMTPG